MLTATVLRTTKGPGFDSFGSAEPSLAHPDLREHEARLHADVAVGCMLMDSAPDALNVICTIDAQGLSVIIRRGTSIVSSQEIPHVE